MEELLRQPAVAPGQMWCHLESGVVLEVLMLTNITCIQHSTHPVSVVYRNIETQEVFSEPLHMWLNTVNFSGLIATVSNS